MDLVNIIMAAYNGEKYISEQIDSILKSNYENWILWIFDDGSTDRTSLILKEYEDKYPDKIKYYKNEQNLGVTKNFLKGLKFAAGNFCESKDITLQDTSLITESEKETYYMFCDQDDLWMPEKIGKTLRHMKRVEKKYGKNAATAVFTDALIADENLKVLYSSFYKRSKLDIKKLDLSHLLMENKLIGCTVMINQTLEKKLTVIPEKARYHDWWIALIAAAFGHISYLPAPTLYYRQHSKNVVGNQSFLAYVKSRIKTMHKQKEVILQTIGQAEEFYKIYEKDLNNSQKMKVYAMAHLQSYDWMKKEFYYSGMVSLKPVS